METVRVVYRGLPFQVQVPEGISDQEIQQQFMAQLEADPDIINRRAKKLGLDEKDLINLAQQAQGQAPTARRGETSGAVDEFLIGAGRTFTSLGRGLRQIVSDDETDAMLRQREADERALFDRLDKEGIGIEDLGQLAPDLLAFLGSGGIASLAARGAALGAATATAGDESRLTNTIVSGVLSVAGPQVAKVVGSVFRSGGRMTLAGIRKIAEMAGKGPVGQQVGRMTSQSAGLAQSSSEALREVGEMGLEQAALLVGKMNSRGKQGVVAEAANSALQKAVKEVDGRNVVDFNAFTRELVTLADSQMRKELGKTFGDRLADMRGVFTELGKLAPDMPPQQAQQILTAITNDSQARALARAITTAQTETAKRGLLERLALAATATASAESGVNVAQELQGAF